MVPWELAPERPRVDHSVDRPELYGAKALQVTGTNGRLLDRFYRSSFDRLSVVGSQSVVAKATADRQLIPDS